MSSPVSRVCPLWRSAAAGPARGRRGVFGSLAFASSLWRDTVLGQGVSACGGNRWLRSGVCVRSEHDEHPVSGVAGEQVRVVKCGTSHVCDPRVPPQPVDWSGDGSTSLSW